MANTYTLTQTGQQVQDILDGMTSAGHARNFLDNWYFLNPVNQRDGHFSPIGVAFFSDAALTSNEGTTANYHALTPVSSTAYSFVGDGTDGTNGTTYYVAAASASSGYLAAGNAYTIDRWRTNNVAGLLVQPTSSGLVLTNTGSAAIQFYQFLEPFVREYLAGQSATFSVLSGGTTYSVTGTITAGTSSATFATATATTGVQLRLAATGAKIACILSIGPGRSITLTSAKLEVGTTSTLQYDAAPSFADELSKCQRFAVVIFADATTYGYDGYAATATTAEFRIPVPATMQATPVLSNTTASNFGLVGATSGAKVPSAVSVIDAVGGSVALRATTTGMTARENVILTYTGVGPLLLVVNY